MTASTIIRFPARHAVIWIAREGPAWIVLARSHGWIHSDYASALADAKWLAKNFGFPIRRAA
jgi:hypothetical protein